MTDPQNNKNITLTPEDQEIIIKTLFRLREYFVLDIYKYNLSDEPVTGIDECLKIIRESDDQPN